MNRSYRTQARRVVAACRKNVALAALGLLLVPAAAPAQQVITHAESSVTVLAGRSALIRYPFALQRVSIAQPEIAEAVVVSPYELMIHGKTAGSTSLLIWGATGAPRLYTVDVDLNPEVLRNVIRDLFPGEDIRLSAPGGSAIVLTGTVSDPGVSRRAAEILTAAGATVVNNLVQPADRQILLRVRFAEVSREALLDLGTNELRILNPDELDDADVLVETISDGLVRLLLFDPDARLDVIIRALKTRGVFRTLAEPNLLVLEGQEASFLAGGEFPYPVVQGGADFDAVTIEFKEFGVRLNFLPIITPDGLIRMRVAPEVSALDFGTGLTISGFRIPLLRTRRAETSVELRPGQHLAIAGLLDHTMDETVEKIPILGDIPILGFFFKNREERQERTELLVVITPELVGPTDTPPEVPTGEPPTWDWDKWMRKEVGEPLGKPVGQEDQEP